MKTIRKVLLVLLLVTAALYLLIVAGVWAGQGYLMFGRRTAAITETPAERHWAFEEVWLDVAGGRTFGWWLPVEGARGAVLYSHGSGRNVSHYLDDAAIFREMGFSVLFYDYGGYGRSTGKPSESRCYADIRAMWKHLTDARHVPANRIVLAGSSMGGGVTSDLAAEVVPAATILECTFTTVPNVLAWMYPWIPAHWIARIHFANVEKAPRFRSPVLVIHSRDDTVVPFAMGRALYEAIPAPKDFIEIHGSHGGGKFTSRDVYVPGVKAFLDRYVP